MPCSGWWLLFGFASTPPPSLPFLEKMPVNFGASIKLKTKQTQQNPYLPDGSRELNKIRQFLEKRLLENGIGIDEFLI